MVMLAAALAGLVFGLGLVVSAMVDPAKVLGFLDLAGDWDPSLILVMATAIPVAALGFALGRKRDRPLLAPDFQAPGADRVDRRLLRGAALFGAGWGLAGYCPGPALAGLALGAWQTWAFTAAMLVGMAAHEAWQSSR